MKLNLQQRVSIKFCVKNGFNGTKSLEILGNCFDNDILKKTTVYDWYKRFKSDRGSIKDDERSGRPSTSKTDKNINKVREMLINNCRLRKLAEDLNIAYGSVQDIMISDLGLHRVAAKLVPKDLNFMQKRTALTLPMT
ncbi:protein GVQW3-like [Solenopsis invicta]|uniref:protein GVQW3-like n=1 Tax=Solenopsis invicta TaxID=13686 RepID=UPI000595D671|nr:protein GVQW3-like [Solenopsis invicta]